MTMCEKIHLEASFSHRCPDEDSLSLQMRLLPESKRGDQSLVVTSQGSGTIRPTGLGCGTGRSGRIRTCLFRIVRLEGFIQVDVRAAVAYDSFTEIRTRRQVGRPAFAKHQERSSKGWLRCFNTDRRRVGTRVGAQSRNRGLTHYAGVVATR
jgi:hypothetical protein